MNKKTKNIRALFYIKPLDHFNVTSEQLKQVGFFEDYE
jgi:hypothetical protein